MRIMAVDQSLSCTAYTVYDTYTKVVVTKGVIRTGSTSAKGKRLETVTYLDSVERRAIHISDMLSDLVDRNSVDNLIMEALSFGSVGNATRDLAVLYGSIWATVRIALMLYDTDLITYAPTTIKAHMRNFLPKEMQTTLNAKGKPIKVKMDKKLMVLAAKQVVGEAYFAGYKMSGKNSGLGDLADSLALLLTYLSAVGLEGLWGE